jgi:signal transduction histidine kinase/CheY-like chemotaxis protein
MFQRRKLLHKSSLSRQLSFIIRGILLAVFVFVYLYTVPMLKQKVFEIERNSSRLALNNVFEIANRMYAGVEQYRQQSLDNHKEQLKLVVNLADVFLQSHFREALKNGVPMEQARQTAFSYLRDFTFGNNDYVWVVDHDIHVLSHPDPRFHGGSPMQVLDDQGQPILESVVRKAMQEGEGYYHYKWSRIDGSEPLDKVSYVKDFPQWGFVIGSGVYLNDLETEVQQRREQALADLRQALQEIKVAKTGYMYVFDSNGHMLIHPNNNLDGVTFTTHENPVTHRPIYQELMQVADTGKELHYRWDKPDDPDNYAYDKLSLVRYIAGFDWYICSSVYLDELQSSSELLSTRIMILAGLTMLATLLISSFFVNRITRPLERLAKTALQVRAGDLSARSGIQRDDEIGILASSFDAMVQRLRNSIETLDAKVKQRTDELLATSAKAQRMNAVGQLSGGLAHDFNNLLSIIVGNLIVAREQHGAHNPDLERLLAPAERAARRGADITHRLLAFSRRQPLQPEAVAVDRLIVEVMELLQGSLTTHYQVTYQAGEDFHQARANIDPGHLENALINLCLNARDAMTDGGQIHISGRLLEVSHPRAWDELVKPGRYVEIDVTDSGSGFSSEALEQAFEPFFSTKTGGNNSGLGLSMVYGFVKQSSGYIRISNHQNGGASVRLLLPACEASSGPDNSTDPITPVFNLKDGLFLLVDDDADVRAVVREQLTALGVHVLEAEDADEALYLLDTLEPSATDLDSNNAPPRLTGVISDVMMPGSLNGRALALLVQQRLPEAVVLLISGYDYAVEQVQDPQLTLLRKPFDRTQLAAALMKAAKRRKSV